MLMLNKNMTTDGTPIKVKPAALQILWRTFILVVGGRCRRR
jgi:hypothetical protein